MVLLQVLSLRSLVGDVYDVKDVGFCASVTKRSNGAALLSLVCGNRSHRRSNPFQRRILAHEYGSGGIGIQVDAVWGRCRNGSWFQSGCFRSNSRPVYLHLKPRRAIASSVCQLHVVTTGCIDAVAPSASRAPLVRLSRVAIEQEVKKENQCTSTAYW